MDNKNVWMEMIIHKDRTLIHLQEKNMNIINWMIYSKFLAQCLLLIKKDISRTLYKHMIRTILTQPKYNQNLQAGFVLLININMLIMLIKVLLPSKKIILFLYSWFTPRKINMEPENNTPERGKSSSKPSFSGSSC